MNKSSISDILCLTAYVEEEVKDYSLSDTFDLTQDFFSGLTAFEERLNIFLELKKRNEDIAREQISTLCRAMEQSSSSDLIDFMKFIIEFCPEMDMFMKFEMTLSLHSVCGVSVRAYFVMLLNTYIATQPVQRPSVTLFLDVLKYLLVEDLIEHEDVQDDMHKCIAWFFNEEKLTAEFKYKTILSMHRDSDRVVYKEHLNYLYSAFFFSTNSIQYKILSSQYIIPNIPTYNSEVIFAILSIAEDSETPYNQRADAADILIRLGPDSVKNKGKNIIDQLAKGDQTAIPTLFSNRQNVHDENIEASVRDFLLQLGGDTFPMTKVGDGERELTFDDVYSELCPMVDILKMSSKIEAINGSLLRIKIDQILYPGSQTLLTIFIKIYSRISKHEHREALFQRLFDELIDMDDTCSSGHASRLVNVFSGVDNFNINIGFRKQIRGNISGRLSKLIQDVTTETRRDELIDQMTNEIDNRPMWNAFFRTHIGAIKHELEIEYISGGYLTEEQFSIFFKDALQFFETGEETKFN